MVPAVITIALVVSSTASTRCLMSCLERGSAMSSALTTLGLRGRVGERNQRLDRGLLLQPGCFCRDYLAG